ncbi:restriction endonuclease subunit S [Micromonospora chokoriensis]
MILQEFLLGDVTVNFDRQRKPVKSAERFAGPYPYYGASGVVDHVVGYLFEGEYLLVAEDGENLRTRKTPVAFIATGKFWANNHAHVLQGNKFANTYYLAYALERLDISGYLTGSTQPKLTQSALNSIRLNLPEKRDQDAIVAVLRALDDKISVNERIAETVHKLAAAEYTRVAQMAERACILGDVIELAYGKALPAAQRRPGQVAVYGSGGISGWHDEPLVRGPGIIVGRKGTVGSVYWSHRDFFPIDTTYFVRVTGDELTTEYAYFLLTRLGLSEMNSDSAVPGLNRSTALAIPVQLPNGKVIAEFTKRIRPLFAMREQTARENETLTQLRDTLLPELMSGRLRVRDAEKVVEEAV